MGAPSSMEQVGRRLHRSSALDHLARVGLVVYGVMHLLIAWTAIRLALEGRGNASSQGALHELARSPLGRGTVLVVGVGFFALVVWQGVEALVGHRRERGTRRTMRRLGSAGRVVVYVVLGLSAMRVGLGAGSGGSHTQSLTARLLAMPGGPLIVAAVGATIVGIGCYLGYKGWRDKFTEDLDVRARVGNRRTPIVLLGTAGYLSKGVAFALVGLLFVWAAWTHDPQKSGGLDQALHKVLEQPLGAPVLLAIAVGIACFGLFCFAWARHLRR
jgi:hypothetical protein